MPGYLGLCYSAFTCPIAIPARHFPLFGTLMGDGLCRLLYSLLVAMPMCLQMFPPELTSVSGICKLIKPAQKCLTVAQR